jgi:hypothetical protein
MTSGQTVRGILETRLWNNTSALFAVDAAKTVDFEKGGAVVATTSGEVKVDPFNVATRTIRT